MKLIKTVTVEGSFQELLQQAAPGERIVVCESDTGDYWSTHTRGVVFPYREQLLLNGEEVLYEGIFNDFGSREEDFVILQGKDLIFGQDQTFLRNGRDVLYVGAYDRWKMHPDGVVIQRDKQLLLNGTHLLYEGNFEEWGLHKDGVVVRKGDTFLLNGEKMLYEGEWDAWKSTIESGLVIERDSHIHLPDGKYLKIPSRELGEEWQLHPQGVIFQIDGQFLLYPFFNAAT